MADQAGQGVEDASAVVHPLRDGIKLIDCFRNELGPDLERVVRGRIETCPVGHDRDAIVDGDQLPFILEIHFDRIPTTVRELGRPRLVSRVN